MLNINFVPDDYTQSSESRRTNFLYLVLLGVVMAALGGSFMTIKVRQRAFRAKEKIVNAKMAQAKEAIKQFEELQKKLGWAYVRPEDMAEKRRGENQKRRGET